MATVIKPQLASAMSRLGTETAFVVLARAKELEAQGKSVIHLEIGEPDFDTPPNIVEAGIRALQEGWTHYGPSHGLPELREAIAADVSRSRGADVSPADVLVTPGAKPIIFFSIMALCNPGDEVLVPDPGFPIYESMVNYVGAKPVSVPAAAGERIQRRSRPLRVAALGQDQAADPQLAEQSDGRDHSPCRHRTHCGAGSGAEDLRAHRRGLPEDSVRGRALQHSVGRRHGGPDDTARRFFQDVRDDRLADGLFGRAALAYRRYGAATDEQHKLHSVVHTASRDRGADGAAGLGEGDGGRNSGAAAIS